MCADRNATDKLESFRSSYEEVLRGELDYLFSRNTNEIFVMTKGKSLLFSDYSAINNNENKALFKIFQLTDACISCGTPTAQQDQMSIHPVVGELPQNCGNTN